MHILVTLPADEAQKKIITDAAPGQEFVFKDIDEAGEADVARADIILGNVKSPQMLKAATHLKWIHLSNAGTDGFCEPGILPEGALLCNCTGAYGPAISEHMVGCVFELYKKLHIYRDNQLKHLWEKEGFTPMVQGKKVLILGFGDIGYHFGLRMHALGCSVTGIKRRPGEKPEWLEGLYTMDALDELLPEADIVALCLPATPATKGIINESTLARMKKTAIILNVGRGNAIDTGALTDALYERKILGAALDVTDPEPLPEEHPLWDAPNTIITPHVSGRTAQPYTMTLIAKMYGENLQRELNGEEIRYVVDVNTGYQK